MNKSVRFLGSNISCICFVYFWNKLDSFVHVRLEFQAIGAEYGEGFETFRPDGPLKVDVVRIFFSIWMCL